jgi:hypothetical protein
MSEGTVTGTIKYVSKFGGIKFEESGDKWFNADKTLPESVRNSLSEQACALVGQRATVELNTGGYYTVVFPAGNEPVNASEHHEETPAPTTSRSTPKKQGGELLDSSFVMKISDKEFVTFEGLLDVAHKLGLRSINTEMLGHTVDGSTTFKATVTLLDGSVFVGHGDASKENVGTMIGPHRIRMAETRAVARALRFATNIGMTSSIELGGEESGD